MTQLRVLLLLLALGCATPSARAPDADAATLRVMTYNIFAGNDLERRSNLERIGAVVDSLDVDVVFLQEVDRGTTRSGPVDQPAVLAGHTKMELVYGPSMDFGGGEFGNAILTRHRVLSSRVVPLQDSTRADSAARATEPRSLLHVVIDAGGRNIHLLNTHLDHRAQSTARTEQLFALLAYVADAVPRDARIIFGGDFNMRPDAPAARALTLFFDDAWSRCGSGDGYTFRSDAPDRRIDYIMLARLECQRAWVPDTRLSDHRPVVVDVLISRDE